MTLRRKWQLALIPLALSFVVFLWFSNTDSLDFTYESPVEAVRPGDSFELESNRTCAPNATKTYRPSFLGRWQETHYNGERDVRRWWELERGSYAWHLACHTSPWVVDVPEDVTGDRIAICDFSQGGCVEIRIDRAD